MSGPRRSRCGLRDLTTTLEDRLSWQFFVVVVASVVCVCKERERIACVYQSLRGEAGAKAGENVCIPSFFQLDFAGRLKRP